MRSFMRLCLMGIACLPAPAQTSRAAGAGEDPRFEIYTGVDTDTRSASLNTSIVWGLFWPVNQPGFRIKLDGLAGLYGDSSANVFSGNFAAGGVKGLGDLMAGYQFNQGPYWFKVYTGAAYQLRMQIVWQAGQIVQEPEWGAAAAVEGFWQVSNRLSFSASLSWLQPDNTVSLYSRSAYLLHRFDFGLDISSGGEAGLTISNANEFKEGKALGIYDGYMRAGPLIDLRYGSHDLTLSGGLSEASEDARSRPYASIRYGRQF